jgi:molecular chaperone GrpE
MARQEPEFAITEEPQHVLEATAGGPRAILAGLIKRHADLGDSVNKTARDEQLRRRRFFLSLLKVADAFDRILRETELAEMDEIARNRMVGVIATSAMLQEVLADEEITAMEHLVGMPFDPASEEAIETRVRPDCPERTVLEVTQKGYHWKEQLLRRARVVVSKQS